ncbi:MAG: nucleotidyltransferase [Chitinispirillia bacterium]|nr:nucleotidyltransferase [Chitinispirillia bacterium]MCL2269114.1 nucleotidyltransferase [Chitinispirillia bacterium]
MDMIVQNDFNDMLRVFNEENVQYLVVGGFAAILHGYERLTKDIDLLVWPNKENSVRVMAALEKFGAPTHDVSAEDFETEGTVFQIGVQPIRIDIITQIIEINFEEAYKNVQIIEINGLKIPLISIPDLIKNKRAAGRPRDLNDAEHLEVILKKKSQAGAR